MKQIARIEWDFHSIQDPALLKLLKYDPKTKIEKLRRFVAINQKLLDSIVVEHLGLFETEKMVSHKIRAEWWKNSDPWNPRAP